MRGWRLILGAAGILVVVYGLVQLVVNVPASSLILVVAWLIGAVIIHDGILSPAVVGIGSIMRRLVPDRGRRYLQAALIMGAIVTLIAIPMIYRQGTQPPSKALLLQNFGANLTLLLGIIGAVLLIAYSARVAPDRSAEPPKPAA
jgi:hypothetical protein